MHDDVAQMFDLTGKVALITGGARTLGYDMCCALAGAGCDVVLTSRKESHAQAAVGKLAETYGVETLPLGLDQTDLSQISSVIRETQAWKGHFDILVNNAGGNPDPSTGNLFERSPEAVARLIALNLTGVLHGCREAGRIMARQRHGKIINIASIAGIVGRDRRMYTNSGMSGQPVDYAAAKAGVIGMTRDLAGFLSPMGINVNAVSPGGFNRNLPEQFVRDYSNRTPLGRMGRDGVDIQGAVLFLASPASDYVTGHNLVVDGGFSIWQ